MKNAKVLLIADFMEEAGMNVLRARDDVEIVMYPPSIAPGPFHELLQNASGVALSYTAFKRPEIAASPKLEVAARIGVGFDAVEVPALTERGIPLMVVGTANSTSVAEHAVFMMMAVAKRAVEMDQRMRQGVWHERKTGLPLELHGHTVLIVGFGRIGTRTAPMCRGFGMDVLVYDPYVPADRVRAAGCEPVASLEDGLARADYVTIHCPRNEETIDLFDAARIARMKPGAILVNTARGGIINEAALLAALNAGHVGGAGLDVYDNEPVAPGNALAAHPAVLSSPHLAGITVQSMEGMSVATARNLLSVLDGRTIRENVVNTEVLK